MNSVIKRKAAKSATDPVQETAQTIFIRPATGWPSVGLKELWQYRELLYFLAWRDIKVRYKQTALGIGWAIIQPFFIMLVFSIFFGHLAKVPSDGIPYPLFVYCALVPWNLFAHSLTESSSSLVANERLITKIYFPRLIVPISAVLAGLVDFAISFIVLVAMMIYYGVAPGVTALSLPLFVLLAVMTALGAGLWLSALNVRYRDVRYVLTFLTQLWLFATPVAYPSSLVPEPWRAVYGLNPMAGVVEGFRWALLGKAGRPGSLLVVSILVAILMLVSGLFYFRRMEATFADVI
jgi:lipopolysaccharide transport system permease protein